MIWKKRNWTTACPELLENVIAGKFIILPNENDKTNKDNLIPIHLKPAYGFGTGHHPTTKMCLELLSKFQKVEQYDFFDIGCGSGILSIAASKLGFKNIFGVDIDLDSVNASVKTAKKNQAICNFWCGEINSFKSTAHLAAANIYREILIRDAKYYDQFDNLIISGFQTEDQEEVLSHLNFNVVDVRTNQDWVACLLSK